MFKFFRFISHDNDCTELAESSIAVILAEQDEVIPNQRTMDLFDGLPSRKKLWRFENAGHNTPQWGLGAHGGRKSCSA